MHEFSWDLLFARLMKWPCVSTFCTTLFCRTHMLQAIISEWQLGILTVDEEVSGSKTLPWHGPVLYFYFLYCFACYLYAKQHEMIAFNHNLMFTLFDNWTSFQCSRQGNLLIQSRCVLWILKMLTTMFPSVFCGRCAGLRIGSHDHLQSMDKIPVTTCNIMQSNTETL